MVKFPDSLINEFARRRCVLFLGAGVSATAKAEDGAHPPGWAEFITGALDLVSSAKIKKEVKRYLKLGNNTLALQIIFNAANKADYIAYVEQQFNSQRYKYSTAHSLIEEMGAKIVITTNFDSIYENYCRNISDQGFKVITYDNESLSDSLRSDSSIIIKTHGTIDNTQKMIFSKSDYHYAKSQYWRFYEILKAIFMTNTVLFLGCGMTDPDLLEILEDVKITATPAKPHYILTKSGQSESIRKDLLDSVVKLFLPTMRCT